MFGASSELTSVMEFGFFRAAPCRPSPASVAETCGFNTSIDGRHCRSGLLRVGDRILAVDGVRTSGKSAAEVSSLIASNRASHVRLQTLTVSAARLLRQRRAVNNGQNYSVVNKRIAHFAIRSA